MLTIADMGRGARTGQKAVTGAGRALALAATPRAGEALLHHSQRAVGLPATGKQPTQDVAGLALRLLQELLFQVNGYSRSGPPVRYAEVGQALLPAPYESRCADVVVRPEPHQVEASRKYSDIDTGVIWPL